MSDRKPRIIYAAKHAGRIIYVGQTLNFPKRVAEHKCSAHWYRDGVYFTKLAEVWGSGDATQMEVELIEKHRPEHNVLHNKSAAQPTRIKVSDDLVSMGELTAEIGCSSSQARRYVLDANLHPAGRNGPGGKLYYRRADVAPLIHRFARRAA